MSERLHTRILNFNKGLLPEMLPSKYEAMTENAFRFFRGTCHLFYEDMHWAHLPVNSPSTWICGDLHLENFGSFKGNNRVVYFDLNDFDESILAPVHFELARILTSIFIAFESLEIEKEKALNMAKLFIKSYCATLVKAKAIGVDPRTAQRIVCDFLTSAAKATEKDILKKRTVSRKKRIMLSLEDERHFKLEKTLKRDLKKHINEWVAQSSDGPYNYKVISAVFRLAGTGSIGQRRYLLLLKSTNTRNKYLLLDMKQSEKSSLAPYVSINQPAWSNESERIITIQQRMQYVSASLLSTTLFRGQPYVIQELQPVKDTIKFKLLRDDYRGMYQVIDEMGALTAASQIRSSGMNGSAIIDDLITFAKRDDWQDDVLAYAKAYASKMKKYFKQYVKAYNNGWLGDKPSGDEIILG